MDTRYNQKYLIQKCDPFFASMAEIGRSARGRAPDGVGAPLARGRVCAVKRRAVPGGDAEVAHFFDHR